MTITIRMSVDGAEATDLLTLDRNRLEPGNLGLHIEEAKALLAAVQETMVAAQASAYTRDQRCEKCDRVLRYNGHNAIIVRTVFGKTKIKSPRFYRCICAASGRESFSPLAELFPERTAPELVYLETKWASLMPYGMTINLLNDVLPVGNDLSSRTIRRNVERVVRRLDHELGDEPQVCIADMPAKAERAPAQSPPLLVGIDGGYVHARGGSRKDGWFEVIVGKSVPAKGDTKCFGFVQRIEEKPKRRLRDILDGQGHTDATPVVFLSDGGESVRKLQMDFSPRSEHILDWFHVTMRITLMKRLAIGLKNAAQTKNRQSDVRKCSAILRNVESVKWNIWHQHVDRALRKVKAIATALRKLSFRHENAPKLLRALRTFAGYIEANRSFIPDYGERRRNGKAFSTAFVESTVDQVVSRRFVKKQKMRWTERGCHAVLQIRTRVINNELRPIMERWHPGMKAAA
jgi:hypothetical protein